MRQIGWLELLIIVLISILIIGPRDFPIVLRKLGTWTNTVKKYFSDVQSNIKEITSLEEKVKQNPASKENKNSVLNKNKNINDKKD